MNSTSALFRHSAITIIGLSFLGFFPACQPLRAPIIVKKPLPIEGKAEPKIEVKTPVGDEIRIGIRVDVSEASISCDAAMEIVDLVTNKEGSWPPGKYVLSASDDVLVLQGKKLSKKIRFISDDANKSLQSGDRSYRGTFVVRANGDKVTIVNEITIDDYLKGVLPREASATWPQPSLRVQAVASRTYLASHLGSHASQGFDLCSDVHCQVYGGINKEHPNTNEAVDSTRDEILVFDGKPIGAFFHSHCGGSTEEIQAVWGNANKPYLPRKRCGYCKGNPRYKWSLSLSSTDILKGLTAKTSVKGEKLLGLRMKKKSGSGRVQFITIKTDKGTFDLKGNDFRIALNPEKIRSTLWDDFSKHGDGYRFEGRGWGHGVGMCQWGAKGQAELGRDYRDILQFYYPHTELRKWSR